MFNYIDFGWWHHFRYCLFLKALAFECQAPEENQAIFGGNVFSACILPLTMCFLKVASPSY